MGNILSNRFYLTLLETIEACLEEEAQEIERANRRRNPNRHRDRGYALREVLALSEETFGQMFRMNRAGFNGLLNKISPFMHETDEAMARVSSNTHISKQTKLYCTLRWLSGV